MRVLALIASLCGVLLAQPARAQEWIEYTSRLDRFAVPAPGQPTVETIAWASEYGATFPGRVYRWQQGSTRYSVTVVDYSDSQRIHGGLNHTAYSGGPPGSGGVYWMVDIVGSVAYAAAKYRQTPGATVTYDAFHFIEFVMGHALQITNKDRSRSYVGIYLHDNRLYVLDATAPPEAAPPIIFQQSFGFLDAEGKPVQYRPFYVNRLPEPRPAAGAVPKR